MAAGQGQDLNDGRDFELSGHDFQVSGRGYQLDGGDFQVNGRGFTLERRGSLQHQPSVHRYTGREAVATAQIAK